MAGYTDDRAVHMPTICDVIDKTPVPSQSFGTWATSTLRMVQKLRSCWRRHVERAVTRMLQETPGPMVPIIAKFVHEQDAGDVGTAFLVGHEEHRWSRGTMAVEHYSPM